MKFTGRPRPLASQDAMPALDNQGRTTVLDSGECVGPSNSEVEMGCGCVFCDLDLRPELTETGWVHRGRNGCTAPCTKT